MAWSAGGPPTALDFFARTPGLSGGRPRDSDFCDVEVDFGATVQVFHVGRASPAVPLALPGLLEAHRRWARLPLPVVAEPAVELGRSGYVLGERVAYVFSLLEPIVTRSTDCRRLYFDGDRIAAAGAQVMSFSTGGGHTINHPLMITMRLTGNRESWEQMRDTMEVDVSDMFDGTPLEVAGQRLLDEVLEICDGKMTKAEALREFNAFAINRCGPSV